MSDEAHLQARHYRRGTILGLTLAELLMLLLFLFLLIMAFLISDREERLAHVEVERVSWREVLSEASNLQLPQNHQTILTEADLERPLEELRRIQEDSSAYRELVAAEVDLSELRAMTEQSENLSALAEAAGASSIEEFLNQMEDVVEMSNIVRPGQSAAATLEEGIQRLGSGREACIRFPREPGQRRGAIAYSFIVTLTPDGVVVREGNREAFEADWTGELPRPPFGVPISVSEFNRLTRSYYTVGENVGAPIPGSSARRPCRFYIALERSRLLTDVGAYDTMLRRVQDNFYKRSNVELVD